MAAVAAAIGAHLVGTGNGAVTHRDAQAEAGALVAAVEEDVTAKQG